MGVSLEARHITSKSHVECVELSRRIESEASMPNAKRGRKQPKLKRPLPLIHVIGLPGAGKTTLASALSKKIGLPVIRIGAFRARRPKTAEGEADAWLDFYNVLSRKKWRNTIIETTGLNRRSAFLEAALPLLRLVTVKLVAPKRVLLARAGRKPRNERGGKWLFSHSYRDKREFIRKMYPLMKKVPAALQIDTSKKSLREALDIVLDHLRRFGKGPPS